MTEDITPIQKQNLEHRFWELSNGGKIQYVKYPIDYNKEAIPLPGPPRHEDGILRGSKPVPVLLR